MPRVVYPVRNKESPNLTPIHLPFIYPTLPKWKRETKLVGVKREVDGLGLNTDENHDLNSYSGVS